MNEYTLELLNSAIVVATISFVSMLVSRALVELVDKLFPGGD